MEWQPIEAAPKDGTLIIVHADGKTVIAYWDGEAWCENDYDNLFHDPTHWMPKPTPPTGDT